MDGYWQIVQAWQGFFQFIFLVPFTIFALVLLAGLCDAIFKMISRIFRSINIWLRGWPPEHLDGDGDWKPLITKK